MSERTSLLDRLLTSLRVNPRSFRALTKAMLWMDLRSQHYAAATATKPTYAVTPLFWVIGQCLAISAISCLVLWLRVSLYMYVMTSIAVSVVVLTSSVLVEFQEIVFNPRDLSVLGPRPIDARTYAATRFCNLLVYVGALIVSLSIFPTILGAAMPDAGTWFVPAFLVASLSASLVSVCITILLLSAVGRSESLEQWKAVLAWTQIVLFAICAYGAQLMFRQHTHAVEVWMAFPPKWVHWLPPAWLAKFVDLSCEQPSLKLLGIAAILLTSAFGLCALTVARLTSMYSDMQPLPLVQRERVMLSERVGTLPVPDWMRSLGSLERRVGFWLCSRALWQNATLRMRCLYPLNIALALVLVGLFADQFANPIVERDIQQVLLPILAVYLTAAAVPVILLNLTFSEEHKSTWALRTAPLKNPAGIALGGAIAVQLWVVTPLAVLLGIVMFSAWQDPVAALGHAIWMWGLCGVSGAAAIAFVVPDLPLSLPPARGSSMGPAVIPLAAFTCAASCLAGVHYLCAPYALFWGMGVVVLLCVWQGCRRFALRRLNRMFLP